MERLNDKWTVVLIVVLLVVFTASIGVAGYTFIYKDVMKNLNAAELAKKQVKESRPKIVKKHKKKKTVKTGAVKKEYRNILEANASGIKGYTWQQKSGGVKNVSIVDINGDGTKELFFMSRDSGGEGNAHLNIYTVSNGRAQKLSYSMSNIDRAGKVTSDGSGLSDFNAASGVRYIVYLNKNSGNLCIYKVFGDTYQDSYVEEYGTANGLVSRKHLFNHYSDMDSADDYYINKKRVRAAEGRRAFAEARNGVGTIIMACDSAWKGVSAAGNMAMSYSQAMQALSRMD
ncbi:MAG: hypothetical protein SOR72_04520 [Hornefia sp.]|nr:hypothetical protein [Hornefia sp.]